MAGPTRPARSPGLRQLLALALCCLVLGHLSASPAFANVREQRLMAAFLFNFVKFVSWPEEAFSSPEASIRIAVLGDASFRNVLAESVEGRVVGGRSIEVVSVGAPADARSAHLLFLPASQAPTPAQVSPLQGTHVLTVADAEGFARGGGMVAFVREGNKLRFEINESAAESAGLGISSRLLQVAKQVH